MVKTAFTGLEPNMFFIEFFRQPSQVIRVDVRHFEFMAIINDGAACEMIEKIVRDITEYASTRNNIEIDYETRHDNRIYGIIRFKTEADAKMFTLLFAEYIYYRKGDHYG